MKTKKLSNENPEGRLHKELAKLRKILLCRTIIEITLFLFAIVFGLTTVAVLIEGVYYLPPFGRWMMLGILTLLSAYLAVRRMISHLGPISSTRGLVLSIESRFPELRQRLITSVELCSNSKAHDIYSSSLINATVAAAEKFISSINSRDLLPDINVAVTFRYLLLSLISPFCLLMWNANFIVESFNRCVNPSREFFKPPETNIDVRLKKTEVIQGDDFSFLIVFRGRLPEIVSLVINESESEESIVREFALQGKDSLHYTLENIQNSFSMQVLGGDGASTLHDISVIQPPFLTNINLNVKYPDYTGLPDRWIQGIGDFEAIIGTTILFEFEASREIEQAFFVIEDTLKYVAQVEGTRAFKSLYLDRDITYYLNIIDVNDLENPDPIKYQLRAVQDVAPKVFLASPGEDGELPDSGELELVIEAEDDFGVENLFLVFDVDGQQKTRIKIPIDKDRNVIASYLWDLSQIVLFPGDAVNYHVEAFDNDLLNGPKKGLSKNYAIVVPSMSERYKIQDQSIKDHLNEIEGISSENLGLENYFEDVRREVLRTEELNWERKQELDSVLRTQESQIEKISELSGKLLDDIDELNEEGRFGEEIAQKVKEIRKLVEDVIAPDLREALADITKEKEGAEAEDLAESLKRFIEQHNKFQKQLDRTIQLLKQVQAEQQLNSLVRRSLELADNQKQINAEIGRKQFGINDQKQQGSMRHEIESITETLEQLADRIKPISRQTSSRLKKEYNKLEDNSLGNQMLDMVKQMRLKSSRVEKIGKGLEEELGEFASSMESIRGEFIAQQKKSLTSDLRILIQNLLALSHRQEELFNDLFKVDDQSMIDASEDQMTLFKSIEIVANKLGEVSRRTMSLEFGLRSSFGYVIKSVKEAASSFGQRDVQKAKKHQWEALIHINETILLIRQSISNLENASMPSSFGEAMQKMLGMSEQQAQVNQVGSRLLKKIGLGESGSGKDLESQLRSLASEQSRIRRILQELQRSLRGRPNAQNEVQAIKEMMQDVIDDLEKGQINQRTLKRQDEIFQRMLQVGNSQHTRGLNKKREAEEGGIMPYLGPPGLPDDLGQTVDVLRELMRRSLENNYPMEYRELMRSYYEKIYHDAVKELENSR